MQDEITQINAELATERLSDAIKRLERAIYARNKKNSAAEKMRSQIVKELDSYISNLETLLNPGKQ